MHPLLASLYAKIPTFTCRPGCTDCCGPVPFARAEWAAVKVKRRLCHGLDCPYSLGGNCAIYENRPLMCRIFGASAEPRLKCPHGCAPAVPLSVEETEAIVRAYMSLVRGK